MPETCPPLSQVLLEVKHELWLRYASFQSVAGSRDEDTSCVINEKEQRTSSTSSPPSRSTKHSGNSCSQNTNWGALPSVVLDALDDEDWNSVIYPVSELKPYLNCVAPLSSIKSEEVGKPNKDALVAGGLSSHFSILESYVQCRCAELPMRLQTEALVLRRHEEARRQYMTQLILLSQFIAYWVSSSSSNNDPSIHITSVKGSNEGSSHVQRCQQRILELEQKVMMEVMKKRKCSQRMILMSAVAYALVNRLDELVEGANRSASRRRQRK